MSKLWIYVRQGSTKLEADFAAMMSTHASPQGMGQGPNVVSHNSGSPAPVTPPTKSNGWSPGNPQRPESYGHQPRPTPSAAPYQGDPWTQPPPTQQQQPQDASDGGWQAPRWANGVGSNMRPFDVRDWTVDEKAAHELKSFDGDITNYDNWRRRVRDNFTSTQMLYKDMFDCFWGEKQGFHGQNLQP